MSTSNERKSRNNDRPEIAMNAPLDVSTGDSDDDDQKYWFFAVNEYVASGGGQRVRIYRSGGTNVLDSSYEDIVLMYTSPNADPESSSMTVSDAWGQSMAFQQTDTDSGLLQVIYRHGVNSNTGVKMAGMETVMYPDVEDMTFGGFSLTDSVDDATSLVPWPVDDDMGLYTGIDTAQLCDSGFSTCPSEGAEYPDAYFFAGWTDGRTKNQTTNDVFAREIVW